MPVCDFGDRRRLVRRHPGEVRSKGVVTEVTIELRREEFDELRAVHGLCWVLLKDQRKKPLELRLQRNRFPFTPEVVAVAIFDLGNDRVWLSSHA